MFLFYSSLSSLTLIIFLPFENLASLPLLFSLSASLPLSRVCCCLIPIADLARSLSLAVVVVFFFGCVWCFFGCQHWSNLCGFGWFPTEVCGSSTVV